MSRNLDLHLVPIDCKVTCSNLIGREALHTSQTPGCFIMRETLAVCQHSADVPIGTERRRLDPSSRAAGTLTHAHPGCAIACARKVGSVLAVRRKHNVSRDVASGLVPHLPDFFFLCFGINVVSQPIWHLLTVLPPRSRLVCFYVCLHPSSPLSLRRPRSRGLVFQKIMPTYEIELILLRYTYTGVVYRPNYRCPSS